MKLNNYSFTRHFRSYINKTERALYIFVIDYLSRRAFYIEKSVVSKNILDFAIESKENLYELVFWAD